MKREHNTDIELPSGYKRIEYIESTGTQYIDTGYMVDNDSVKLTEVLHDAVMVKSSTNGANGKDLNGFFFWGMQSNGCPYAYCGSSTYKHGIATNNERHIYELSGVEKTFSIDDNVVYRFANNTLTRGSNIYLCAVSGYSDGNYYMKEKTFELIILKDGEIVYHGIPALRLSDNKPGLYDVCETVCPLTNTPFYVNKGTGEFLYA